MRRKINWGNLIKLIIMAFCILIVVYDYANIIISMFGKYTLGFTWYGIIINLILLSISQIIYSDLFERN